MMQKCDKIAQESQILYLIRQKKTLYQGTFSEPQTKKNTHTTLIKYRTPLQKKRTPQKQKNAHPNKPTPTKTDPRKKTHTQKKTMQATKKGQTLTKPRLKKNRERKQEKTNQKICMGTN